MFINRSKDTSASYIYNKEKGSVTYKSIHNNALNNWLNKCNTQYENTNKGLEPSVFLPIGLFTAGCWIIIFFAYFTVGGIASMEGIYWALGILTVLNLLCVILAERLVFWYVPICISLVLLVYIKYGAPYIVHKHVESCKTGQSVARAGKLDDKSTCIYEGYIINHLNEFK